jgi:hypothetical protein
VSKVRRGTYGAAVAAVASALVCAAVASSAQRALSFPAAKTFGYTGKQASYTVPPDVELMFVETEGGSGGNRSSAAYGANLTGWLRISPASRLYLDVGENSKMGGGSTFGGGGAAGSADGAAGPDADAYSGAGATDIRATPSIGSRLLVAAGSGGAGGDGQPEGGACDSSPGNGNALDDVVRPTIVKVAGGIAYAGQKPIMTGPTTSAGDGQASAPGSGGRIVNCTGANTTFGQSNPGTSGSGPNGGTGGDSVKSTNPSPVFITGPGGGGGGGYFGGGGGNSGVVSCPTGSPTCGGTSGGGGGGAGSSFASVKILFPIAISSPNPFGQVTMTPALTVTAPAQGATYRMGQHLTAGYACNPDEAKSCKGTVADGAAISTATPGRHTFEVTMTVETGGYAGILKPITVDVSYTVAK